MMIFSVMPLPGENIICRWRQEGNNQDFPDSLKRLAFLILCYNGTTISLAQGQDGKKDRDH
jgi:hypothetical protein